MADLSTIRLYRLTHIENIPHILEHGITHVASEKANPNYQPIGDPTLISTRDQKFIPKTKNKKLGDFTSFYFGFRTPMLYVIQNGYNEVNKTPPEQIVYLVSSVQRILDSGLEFFFTNGHAVNGLTDFFDKNEINRVDQLVDFPAVKARNWKCEEDTDLKRRKEAEFLLLGDLPPEFISGFVTHNETSKKKLIAWGVPENQVVFKKDFYFYP